MLFDDFIVVPERNFCFLGILGPFALKFRAILVIVVQGAIDFVMMYHHDSSELIA
jgi:hypothetical protein